MVIYILKNSRSLRPDKQPKVYIGKSSTTHLDRWEGHCYDAVKGSKLYLHRAIRKYGESSFLVEILEENIVNTSMLNIREKFWIKTFNSNDASWGYNMTAGGEGGNCIANLTDEEYSVWLESVMKNLKKGPAAGAAVMTGVPKKLEHQEKCRENGRKGALAVKNAWAEGMIVMTPEWQEKCIENLKKGKKQPKQKIRLRPFTHLIP